MLTTMIFAKDHDALVIFYREGFDLVTDAAASSEGYTVLAGNATRLSIHAIPPDTAAGIEVAEPPQPRRESALKLLFEVRDLEATSDRLVALGAQFFAGRDDGALDGCDVEGNIFRVAGQPSHTPPES